MPHCALQMISASIFFILVIPYAGCDPVLPTREEQVNLLTQVYQLLEQLGNNSHKEAELIDRSVKMDMEKYSRTSRVLISVSQELALLKLTSKANSVCSIDAKGKIEDVSYDAFISLSQCTERDLSDLTENSINVTAVIQSAIKSGKSLLEKLEQCSEKRGLGVIACYKKIIQFDVVPVKEHLSKAIEDHAQGQLTTFGINERFYSCVDKVMDSFRDKLDANMDAGMNCN
ncbi:uncharacterized protein LOC126746466 [Anthonomus grandis grandis]|uniref:uncharacterized protein LOC126746466 n=1 Tax=Anthonomus grandis grandis TaxID=2921223 RepID=UPI0021662AFE|nr:uncharacterized protein LOC126746466 [Anthonomus grandis grandis]